MILIFIEHWHPSSIIFLWERLAFSQHANTNYLLPIHHNCVPPYLPLPTNYTVAGILKLSKYIYGGWFCSQSTSKTRCEFECRLNGYEGTSVIVLGILKCLVKFFFYFISLQVFPGGFALEFSPVLLFLHVLNVLMSSYSLVML